MNLHLHANATTTPKIRALIQSSMLGTNALARELGVSVGTVRRWRRRDFQQDASHTPHHLATTLTPAQEAVAARLVWRGCCASKNGAGSVPRFGSAMRRHVGLTRFRHHRYHGRPPHAALSDPWPS